MVNIKLEEENLDSLNLLKLLYRSFNIQKTMIFDDNFVKFIEQKNGSIIIPYTNIKSLKISLYVDKNDLSPFTYGNRERMCADFRTTVQIETNDSNNIYIRANSTIKDIYKLIDLRYKCKNFNLDVIEENSLRGRFSVPLFLYCNTGKKFIISAPFFGIHEYIIILTIAFFVLFVLQVINYATGLFDFIFFLVTLIPSCISSYVIIKDEYNKKHLLNNFHIDKKETEYISDIGSYNKSQITIIENSKVLYSKKCIEYLTHTNYIGLVLSISILSLFVYLLFKLYYFGFLPQ